MPKRPPPPPVDVHREAALSALQLDTHLESRILIAVMRFFGWISADMDELSRACSLDHIEVESGARCLQAIGLATWRDGVLTIPDIGADDEAEG